ncbi:MAG TPA: hypothetical protein DDX07_08600 [Porphyromonadaceae bacterium]|nr:hypothetical protein [Porphyromonadaceae bacterium]
MRKLLFLSFTIVLGLSIPVDSLHAQTSKKEIREILKSLQNEKEIDVTIDMSRVIIHGYCESDFVYRENLRSDRDWPTLWESKYKPGLIVDFMNALNLQIFDYGHSVRFGNFGKAKYQIRLIVNSIHEKGSVYMKAFINKREQEESLYELTIYGGGGIFGSKVNLMGDGFKRAGWDLARQMNILFKKGKVSKLKQGQVRNNK